MKMKSFEETKESYTDKFKAVGLFAISPYYTIYEKIHNPQDLQDKTVLPEQYHATQIAINEENILTNTIANGSISKNERCTLIFITGTLIPVLPAATLITASLALIAAVMLAIVAAFELAFKAGLQGLSEYCTDGSSAKNQCK